MDTVGEGVGGTNWEISMETNILPYVKYITICKIASENCYMTLGAQTHALWQYREVPWNGRWEGGLRGGDVDVDVGRNQHNTVKQISSN